MHAFSTIYVILPLWFNMSIVGGCTVPSALSKCFRQTEGVNVGVLFLSVFDPSNDSYSVGTKY
jgi:hypothetical protein